MSKLVRIPGIAFHKFFLPSFSSFGRGFSEEKIKM
jgi:hypothetical protein